MSPTMPARSRTLIPLAAAAAAVGLALTGALPAQAAGAYIEHGTFDQPDNLCGIDTTLTGGYQLTVTPNQQGASISVYRQRVTETAANGKSVTIGATQVQRLLSEVQNPDGTVTDTFDLLGSPERIAVPGQGTVLVDAGQVRVVDVLDYSQGEPVLVSETVTVVKGPHPDLQSGFTLGCQIITAALS